MDSTSRQSSILILGLGDSGLAAAELALSQGARTTVLDANASESLNERARRLENRGATVHLDYLRPDWDEPVELAVISPGIAPESTLGRLADSLPCPVISELEFGYRACACPVLAVSGTNGKTTTVELTVHCLKGAGKKVLGGGNLGPPLSEIARKSAGLDCIVAEVSSFQLERVDRFAPLAVALLNVTSDHLDRYPDAAAYLAAKLRLFRNLARRDRVVIQQSLLADPAVVAALPAGGGQPISFSIEPEKGGADYFLAEDGTICYRRGETVEPLLSRRDLKLQGGHNVANVCAAMALCQLAGVEPATVVPHLKRFAPSAHRLELVSVRGGVKYINDSKATNPDALIQAIRAIRDGGDRSRGKIILIAGGRDKRMDFTPVVPYLRECVKEVYLIGESKETLATLWGNAVTCMKFTSLAACVEAAVESARSGDVVLLSPGCASQDMFDNYAHRGNVFSQEVNRRLGE